MCQKTCVKINRNLRFKSHSLVNSHGDQNVAVLDKSLDLEKFSKRNYSWFSLSSWRSEFSCIVLLSIFKILKTETEKFLFLLSVHKIFVLNFSFSSRFSRFCRTISLSPLDFQYFEEKFLFLLSIFKIF